MREPAIKLIAHRGASHDAPENTLAAFKLAWTYGVAGIEGDFQLTADERIVCIHDPTTARTGGLDLPVASSSLSALTKLDVGLWKGKQWAGERIPTIEEVLLTGPGGKDMYIDIKSGAEIIAHLRRILARSRLHPKHTTILSSDPGVIKTTREQIPHVKAYLLISSKEQPFPSAKEMMDALQSCDAHGLGVDPDCPAERDHAEALEDAGKDFYVWAVNDFESARRFANLGATSMSTDKPRALRKDLLRLR